MKLWRWKISRCPICHKWFVHRLGSRGARLPAAYHELRCYYQYVAEGGGRNLPPPPRARNTSQN